MGNVPKDNLILSTFTILLCILQQCIQLLVHGPRTKIGADNGKFKCEVVHREGRELKFGSPYTIATRLSLSLMHGHVGFSLAVLPTLQLSEMVSQAARSNHEIFQISYPGFGAVLQLTTTASNANYTLCPRYLPMAMHPFRK